MLFGLCLCIIHFSFVCGFNRPKNTHFQCNTSTLFILIYKREWNTPFHFLSVLFYSYVPQCTVMYHVRKFNNRDLIMKTWSAYFRHSTFSFSNLGCFFSHGTSRYIVLRSYKRGVAENGVVYFIHVMYHFVFL